MMVEFIGIYEITWGKYTELTRGLNPRADKEGRPLEELRSCNHRSRRKTKRNQLMEAEGCFRKHGAANTVKCCRDIK